MERKVKVCRTDRAPVSSYSFLLALSWGKILLYRIWICVDLHLQYIALALQQTKFPLFSKAFHARVFFSPSRACPGQRADLSSLVSEGFVRFFVELVGHYPLHMLESTNGSREFQRDNFRKSHPSRGVRQFLQLFMDTQMFAGFIQDKELRKGGGRGTWWSSGTRLKGGYSKKIIAHPHITLWNQLSHCSFGTISSFLLLMQFLHTQFSLEIHLNNEKK